MELFLHDVRHAASTLRRHVSFTVVMALTLGLGAGVLTALFAVVQAVLLRPVATAQDRVVRIWKIDVQRGSDRHPVSYPEFLDSRDHGRSFRALAAINYADANAAVLDVGGEPARVWSTPVSSDFFAVLQGDPIEALRVE